jgi:hypothetical protein
VPRRSSLALAILTSTALLTLSPPARAEDDRLNAELALLAGYEGEPAGVALGARFGISYRHVYVGMPFVYDLGGGSSDSQGETAYSFAVEAGYGFVVGPGVTIRPTVGFGHLHEDFGGDSSDGSNFVQPLLTVLVPAGPRVFVGIDGGVRFFPPVALPCPLFAGPCSDGPWTTAVVAHAQVGFGF